MNFIPYGNFQIETQKSVEDCMKGLIPHVNMAKGAITGVVRVGKFFRGHLKGDTFSIRRISKAGTAVKPYVKGTISKQGSGALIKIEVKLSRSVYFNLGTGYLIILISLIFSLMDSDREWYVYLLPFFILIFGYTLMLLNFNQETQLAEGKLMEIFSDTEQQ